VSFDILTQNFLPYYPLFTIPCSLFTIPYSLFKNLSPIPRFWLNKNGLCHPSGVLLFLIYLFYSIIISSLRDFSLPE